MTRKETIKKLVREAELAKLGRIERRTGRHRHAAAIAVDCIPPTLPLPFPILPPLFLHIYRPVMEAASPSLGNNRIYCCNEHGGCSTTIIRCKQLTIVHAVTYLHRSLPIYLFINVSMNLSTAIWFSDGGLSLLLLQVLHCCRFNNKRLTNRPDQ